MLWQIAKCRLQMLTAMESQTSHNSVSEHRTVLHRDFCTECWFSTECLCAEAAQPISDCQCTEHSLHLLCSPQCCGESNAQDFLCRLIFLHSFIPCSCYSARKLSVQMLSANHSMSFIGNFGQYLEQNSNIHFNTICCENKICCIIGGNHIDI